MTIDALFVELRRGIGDATPEQLPAWIGRLVEVEELARLRLREPEEGFPVAATAAEPLLLTCREAAALLSVSPSYVETLVRQGKIAHVRLPATDRLGKARNGRLVRIRPDDLRALAHSTEGRT